MKTKKLLLEVKKAREEEKEAMRLKKEIMASPLVSAVVDDHKKKKMLKDEAEKALREHALGIAMRGNKLLLGLKTRKTSKLSYSASAALEWCKVNFIAALTVDKKKFEKYVKAADEKPDFVEVIETLSVTIPTDLSGIEE